MNSTKILFIVRHAKSSWEYDSVSDADRPLTEKGISNAYEVSTQLRNEGLNPGLIMSSPANRALHTAVIFAGVTGYPVEKIIVHPVFYEGTTSEIIKQIHATDESILSLMIFGHNPVSTYLVNHFGNKAINNLPTSGAVRLAFKTIKWSEIEKSRLEAQNNFFPVKKK